MTAPGARSGGEGEDAVPRLGIASLRAAAAVRALRDALTSLKLTLACLAVLMALVALCTLGQVRMGTFASVETTMRSFFLYARLPGAELRLPVFPGGALAGLALLSNLSAVMLFRLKRSWSKAPLWLIHLGLILLIAGEFSTGMFAVESQMAVEEGETKSWVEESEPELAIVDSTDPGFDEVFSIGPSRLTRPEALAVPGLPFGVLVKRFYANSALESRPAAAGGPARADGSAGSRSMADRGAGPGLAVRPIPVSTTDEPNLPSAFVELFDGDRTIGTWLVSAALEEPQAFSYLGRDWRLSLRPRRRYLPFSLGLKDFRHESYAGTDIPKSFASLVRLRDPQRGQDREVLISMNHPLRYGGLTFYQASFGRDDRLSVLQVVRNPGWLLPYASCALIAAGLVLQFLTHLIAYGAKREGRERREAPREAAVP